MEILSVTLKNFKSHSDRQFTFQPGTNAICGENGAGKTSILEAIAWVLFNHRGAYKTEDLVRNGSGSAQAIVVFISNRDGRTYEVQRCTAKGYSIYDPQLGIKLDYRHIEDEIMPWLRQQFGVAPGTDLARLFANTIGVPQGTFTADFLQAPDKRKQIFDSILKVEEYRQTNQQLLGLEKYSKAKVDHLAQTLSQYEETLRDQPLLQTRHQSLSQEIVEAEATLHQLQAQLSRLQTEKAALEAQAQQLQALTLQLGQTTAQLTANQQTLQHLQQAVEQSQQAVQFCLANRDSYQGYLQAEARLAELDQQTKQRQQLWRQRETQRQQFMQQQQQLTRLSLQLEGLAQAQADLETLRPLIAQQESYEQQQTQINHQLAQLQGWKREQQSLTRQLDKLRLQRDQLLQTIQQSQAQQSVSQIPVLEQKRQRLQEQLSRIEAAK
ncbi:MAG: AAA family ATPase, partial [Elainella sp.]